MPGRTYSIKFLIDDALAQAAVRRSVAGIEAIERAANRAAQAVQRAHAGGGAGGGGTAGGAGAGPSSSPQARAAVDLDALQDRLILKDYNRRVQFERQQISSAERAAAGVASAKAREAAQLEAIQDRYIKRDYDQRVSYEQRKIAAAESSAARQERLIAQGFLVAGAVALKGLETMSAAYEKIRKDAEAAAVATLDLQKHLRVEATLTGKAPDAALLEHIRFRAETGLGRAEASEFIKQYEGTTPIAFEKGNITQQVSDELRRAAGTRAARIGGEAGTHAELAGLLGQFAPVKSAQAGLSQLEAIRIGLVKGRGDDSPLTRQMLNVAGSLAGEGHAVPSLPELAALIGVTSLSGGPQQAADRANQLYRGLKIGLTKQTKVRGTDQAQGAYLKGLGVQERDTLETTLDKIAPDLQRARDAGRDLDAYLASKNFRAADQRRAIIETFENYAPLKTRMKEAREAGLGETLGAGEIEKNRAYLADPLGQREVGLALQEARTSTRGVEGRRLEALMAVAEASPEIAKGDKSFLTQMLDKTLRAPVGGREFRVREQALADLRVRARGAGVTEAELAPFEAKSARNYNYDPEFVNQVEALITKRGGTLETDIKPVLEKLTIAIQKQNDLAEGKGKAPAPLPVRPPQAEAGR